MNDQPREGDGKPKPVHIDDLRKRAEAEGVTEEEAAERLRKTVSNLAEMGTKPLRETLKGITDLASAKPPKLSVTPVEDLSFVKSFREAEASRTAQLDAIREAQRAQMEEIYEAQQEERARQDQLEAERIEREKENLAVAKESRDFAKHSRQIAIWALVVAVLGLAAAIVIPLAMG